MLRASRDRVSPRRPGGSIGLLRIVYTSIKGIQRWILFLIPHLIGKKTARMVPATLKKRQEHSMMRVFHCQFPPSYDTLSESFLWRFAKVIVMKGLSWSKHTANCPCTEKSKVGPVRYSEYFRNNRLGKLCVTSPSSPPGAVFPHHRNFPIWHRILLGHLVLLRRLLQVVVGHDGDLDASVLLSSVNARVGSYRLGFAVSLDGEACRDDTLALRVLRH